MRVEEGRLPLLPIIPVRVMITGSSTIDDEGQFLERISPRGADDLMSSILGDNFLAYLTLALGAALAIGTGLALLRPQTTPGGEVIKAPLRRSLIQITIGSIAAVWALATIVS